jgi:hypothetical protein
MQATEVSLIRGKEHAALLCGECKVLIVGVFVHPCFVSGDHVKLECPQGADNTAGGRILIEVETEAQKRLCSRSLSYSAAVASSSAMSCSISSRFA